MGVEVAIVVQGVLEEGMVVTGHWRSGWRVMISRLGCGRWRGMMGNMRADITAPQ